MRGRALGLGSRFLVDYNRGSAAPGRIGHEQRPDRTHFHLLGDGQVRHAALTLHAVLLDGKGQPQPCLLLFTC